MINGSWPGGAKSAVLTVNGTETADTLVSLVYTDDLTAGGSAMTIGAASAARVRFVVDSPSVSYDGAVIGLRVGGIPLGRFYVTDHSENDGRLTVDAVDALGTGALQGAYVPAAASGTALSVVRTICAAVGLTLADVSGITDVAVSGLRSGSTYREMLGNMAAVLGRNAHIDREGRLALRWYKAPGTGSAAAVDAGGGHISLRGMMAEETADGGVRITRGAAASESGAGRITLTSDGTYLVTTDDVYAGELSKKTVNAVLTGIACTVTTTTEATDTDGAGNTTDIREQSTQVLTAGGAANVSLRCDCMTQTILDGIYARIGGFTYCPMTLTFYGDCRLETGDILLVADRSGNCCSVPAAAVIHSWDGGVRTTVTAGAPAAAAGGAVSAALSRVSRELEEFQNREAANIEAVNRKIAAESASREQAIAGLSAALARSSGLYETQETVAGGGTIYYLHDKPALSASSLVIKLTADALGISTDGGRTYTAGHNFATGTTVTDILEANGVNADWISSGRIESRNGRVYFDLDNNMIVCSRLQASRPWDSTTGEDPGDVIIDISKRNISGSRWSSYANIYKSGNEENGLCIMPPRSGSYSSYAPNNRVTVFTWGDNPIELRHHSGMAGSSGDYTSVMCLSENMAEIYAKSSTGSGLNGFWMDDAGIHASGTLSAGALTAVSLAVTGAKQRIVETEDYGVRSFYCYETPSPLFGDVGEGVIGEDGRCHVFPDPVFAQAIAPGQYQVFLQTYGPGECFVARRQEDCFVVEGTPGLSFGWELKAKQAGFSQKRLEKQGNEVSAAAKDYGGQALAHIASVGTDYMAEAAAYFNGSIESEESA